MKKIIALALIALLPALCFSDDVKCYSAKGKLVYSHRVKDVSLTNNIMMFTELSTGFVIVTNAYCIATIDVP